MIEIKIKEKSIANNLLSPNTDVKNSSNGGIPNRIRKLDGNKITKTRNKKNKTK